MAEQRSRPPTDADLAVLLRDVAAHIAYPPTPSIAAAVRQRLAAQPRPAPPFWAGWLTRRRLAVALVVVLLLAATGLALTPGALTAVAERLGLRGVTIEFVPAVPTPAPTASPAPVTPSVPAPTPPPVGARLALGRAVSLADARQFAPFPVAVPALDALGAPDEIYIQDTTAGRPVTLVYRARPGLPPAPETGVALLLTQLQGEIEPRFFGKGLAPETRLEEIELNGRRAYWIEGKVHAVFVRDPNGVVRDETVRLAGNVLLWEDGPVELRLEGAPTKAEALRIAASLART